MKTREFIIAVLEKSKDPLSYKEIYDKGLEYGYDLDYNGDIRNAPASIHSIITQDIAQHGSSSAFVKLNNYPILFGLAKYKDAYSDQKVGKAVKNIEKEAEKEQKQKVQNQKEQKKEYRECDLHPVLVKYLISNNHFRCFAKTIKQQEGGSGDKGDSAWRYPDLIGIYDAKQAQEYKDCTFAVMDQFHLNRFKVFSFEMKREITQLTARMDYFQAVSNSSWANEGYLVTGRIENSIELMKDLALLNNLFGIGIIILDIMQPDNSTILFPSKEKANIDVGSLDALIVRNQNKKGQIGAIIRLFDYVSGRSADRPEAVFDEILSDEEYSMRTKDGVFGLCDYRDK